MAAAKDEAKARMKKIFSTNGDSGAVVISKDGRRSWASCLQERNRQMVALEI